MKFNPTPELRWLERDEEFQPAGSSPQVRSVRVLQVGYRPIHGGQPVWSDVPVVDAASLATSGSQT